MIELAARRAVVPLFESENLPPGYAFLEQRFFGGFVPRFVRIRLFPESDGDPAARVPGQSGREPDVCARIGRGCAEPGGQGDPGARHAGAVGPATRRSIK